MPLLTVVLLTVTIRTYDSYGVAGEDLHTAIRVAAATLAAAGISTEWIACSPAAAAPERCGTAPERSEIIVRIGRAPKRSDAGDALGNAAVDTVVKAGALVTLFADRVVSEASAAGADPGALLGRAAAHEIGHLLMGTTAHAPHGLMRAHWSRLDLQRRFERDWEFSAHEAQQMQRGVAARANSAAADLVVAAAALGRQQER